MLDSKAESEPRKLHQVFLSILCIVIDIYMTRNISISAYKKYVQSRLKAVKPVFAKAAVGDFSTNIKLPSITDEFTELYTGIQIMLEVIRNQIQKLNQEIENKQTLTQKLLASNALIDTEKVYDEALMDSIGDGVIVTDAAGVITFFNPQAELLLGWKAQDAVGKHFFQVTRMSDASGQPIAHQKRPFRKAMNTQKKISGVFYYLNKDGTRFPVLVTAAPVIFGDEIIGAVDVFRDYTKEIDLDRMKDEFISMAAHQLRAPLGTMRWSLELLLKKNLPLDPTSRDRLQNVYRNNLQMITLVKDLLDVSRIPAGVIPNEPQLLDISPIIASEVKDLSGVASGKKVTLRYKPPPTSLPQVKIDPRHIREIIQNLITNAIKFNIPKGQVLVSAFQANSHVHLSISDTGIGIPKNERNKIFTKFFSAANSRLLQPEGSGLGLFIVKSYVDIAKGRIWVVSPDPQTKKGTCFHIELPSALAKEPNQPIAETARPTERRGQLT